MTSPISHGRPNTWTGRTARVREVTAAGIAFTSRLSVSSSMSTKTGRAPSYRMTFALATNENGVVITSSPRARSSARTQRWRPAVPFATATACLTPIQRARRSSNSGTRGPRERVGVRSTFATASRSAFVRSGRERGIIA